MTDDNDSLGDKIKGGFGTVGKLAVFTGIVGAATIKKIKDTVVGDPPSPWRKGLVLGSAALALGYTACEDEIDTAGQRTYTYLEGQRAERVDKLERELTRARRRTDSLTAENEALETEISDLTGAYQNTVDSLTEEETAVKQRLDSMVAAYNADEPTPTQPSTPQPSSVDTVVVQNNTEITVEKENVTEATETQDAYTAEQQGRPRQGRRSQGCWHPIQAGETLSEVSAQYHGSSDAYTSLAAANNIDDPKRVPVGFPLRLDMEPCPASTTQLPTYTVIERDDHDVVDDLQRITDTPREVLAYNQRRGNRLQASDNGDEIAVYLP